MTVNNIATEGGQAAALPAHAVGNVIYLPGCAPEPVVQNRRRGRLPSSVTKLQTVRNKRSRHLLRIAELKDRIKAAERDCRVIENILDWDRAELQSLQVLLNPQANTRSRHEL